jgi:hypothetical protein
MERSLLKLAGTSVIGGAFLHLSWQILLVGVLIGILSMSYSLIMFQRGSKKTKRERELLHQNIE